MDYVTIEYRPQSVDEEKLV